MKAKGKETGPSFAVRVSAIRAKGRLTNVEIEEIKKEAENRNNIWPTDNIPGE